MNDNLDLEQIKQTLLQHGYEYIQLLGKGGFSNVFLCQSKKYNQNFAVKRAIKHKLTEDEYSTLILLNHPNIIRLYDSFNDDEAQYLVMEYCPNGTIRGKGRLNYDQFICYGKQILEVISFCHSNNVAHRDIKPENIFFDQYDHIKLADFGMAKQFEIDGKSSEKCGSIKLFPPEMFQCKEICPFKADIWALGVTFFYMASGSYPFISDSIEELKQLILMGEFGFAKYQIDSRIVFLIKKMTDTKPNLRATADSLLKLPMFIPLAMGISRRGSFVMDRSARNSSRKSLPMIFRHPPQITTQRTLTFNEGDSNSTDNDDAGNEEAKKPVQIHTLHTYKSLNLFPSIPAPNYHFQVIRPA